MSFPDFNSENPQSQWKRFCELLWYDDDLGFWLDISRMHFNNSDFKDFSDRFSTVFMAMDALERGSMANPDESRQVGHYWLRNSSIAPSSTIANGIEKEIQDIEDFAAQLLDKKILSTNGKPFTDVLWIGIGGSGLGPLLLTNALDKSHKGLRFSFLDNVDPQGIYSTLENLRDSIPTTLVVTVSKSGSTPEPNICMSHARLFLERFGGIWSKQAVAITMKDSKLDNFAKKENWLKTFDLPDWVGGRTSITSAVGLLPSALMGVDIKEFLNGASKMDQLTRNKNLKDNPSALLAFSWFISGNGKGLRDMVVLPYRDRLELFSRYLQQLVMESLGKKLNRSGVKVDQGLSVYGNKGSTDQHAYVQQLRDGLDNFFINFIEVLENLTDIPQLNDQRTGDVLSGFLQGTRSALTQAGKQTLTITISSLTPQSLGALIALFERAVGFYGELIDVNAYHQPGVEAGKKAATSILELQSRIEDLLTDGEVRTLDTICEQLNIPYHEDVFWISRNIVKNDSEYFSNEMWGQPLKLAIGRK